MLDTALTPETEILSRVIAPEKPDLSPDAARSLLALHFSQDDVSCMNDLAKKARQGALTPQEDRLLQSYLFVGSVVDLIHSKARLSLKRSTNGNGA